MSLQKPLAWQTWHKRMIAVQVLYVVVAFGGSATMRLTATCSVQAAEQVDQATDRMNRIETHLDATDTRVSVLSDKTSTIEGVGTGALGVLGVLQLLGLIATANAAKAK